MVFRHKDFEIITRCSDGKDQLGRSKLEMWIGDFFFYGAVLNCDIENSIRLSELKNKSPEGKEDIVQEDLGWGYYTGPGETISGSKKCKWPELRIRGD